MKQSEIAQLRLVSQQLVESDYSTPKEIVSWMGAIQAQDYPMAKWAIGARLPGLTDLVVENVIAHANIIRTHLLRPTWHFVAAEDVYWMIDLTAPQIKASQSSREQQLGITEELFTKSNITIEKALSKGEHLTREELISSLHQAGIATDQNRASHLFARAELEKIICSGASRGSKTTYALLSERVTKPAEITRDEALEKLARRYFTSRSPATLHDFTWWSGLPAWEASKALELVKSEFDHILVDEQIYWLLHGLNHTTIGHDEAHLLPPFDEFIISYSDRGASIPTTLEQHMKQISDRGVFRPIIVVDGQVVGIWKRSMQNESVRIEIQPFTDLIDAIKEKITKIASRYGSFLGKEIELL
jgi:DNA glycosylase AlkZ-like